MQVNEVAKLCGITVRTLHYYDEIGLLSPSKTTEAGYRIYDASDLERLQQILFFRELSFPLKQIKEIVTSPHFDRDAAMHSHLCLLQKKREHLDGLIKLLERIQTGGDSMSFQEFDTGELQEMKDQYAREAKERWGHTEAYAESQRRTTQYTPAQWKDVQGEMEHIFAGFAALCKEDAASQEAQALVGNWQQMITERFYPCTNEILSSLGQMYVQDERFAKNLDQYGEGTAQLLAKAIEIYCKRNK